MQDKEILGLVEEERFSGVKHAPRTTPTKSIDWLFRQFNVSFADLDGVAVGFEAPVRSMLMSSFRNVRERNWERVVREPAAYLEYIIEDLRFREFVSSRGAGSKRALKQKLHYFDHHLAHAASAARTSGFDSCIVLTWDGVGENCAGIFGLYKNGRITVADRIPINQSLGWLYSEATVLCGFKSHSHEGKLMGLAAFGEPQPNWYSQIGEIGEDGYRLHREWRKNLRRLFDQRKPSQPLEMEHKNLAATVQKFLEDAIVAVVKAKIRQFGVTQVACAGGVALNCDANARILSDTRCTDLFVQPAANDAGTSLGAALELNYELGGESSVPLTSPYLGPEYSNDEIKAILDESKLVYQSLGDEVSKVAAQHVVEGKIVGTFNGRSEFGPRALGGRSIIALPADPAMKDKINAEVKHREPWRPFAPAVLAERCPDYFRNYYKSPYMLLTFEAIGDGTRKLGAATHVDGTARVQEVSANSGNATYRKIIEEVDALSGIPAVLNTSFNDHEKPICLTPRDAIQTFFSTGLDVLLVGQYCLEKKQ